jgi:formylglycine-generating enzyme required for sulfatase activity
MTTLVLAILVGSISTTPAEQQAELLRTFRNEFISVTPGEGRFPAVAIVGSDADPTSRPQRTAPLAGPFAIGRYEIPQDLWEAVMGQNPSRWIGPRNSVEMVSFEDAQLFCRRITQRLVAAELINAQEEIRLPTEIEWEYAARAGTTTAYSFGDAAGELGKYAWFADNAAGNDPPVGAKQPNPWGLYDVHGYLWEWCLPSDDQARAVPSGKAVLRGGSWKDPAAALTSSYRRIAPKDLKDDAVGIRCVLVRLK